MKSFSTYILTALLTVMCLPVLGQYTGGNGRGESVTAVNPVPAKPDGAAQVATQVVITYMPTSPINCLDSVTIVAEIQDADGVRVNSSASVSLSFANNPGSASFVGGNTTVNAIEGVATFSGMIMDAAASNTGYTLQASSTGLSNGISAPFDLIKLTPQQLAIILEPQDVERTIGFDISVEVQTAGGQKVPGATNTVTVSLQTNPGSATLSGITTVNAIDGVATFTGLSLNQIALGYRLQVTSPGLTLDLSQFFDVYQFYFGGQGRGEAMTDASPIPSFLNGSATVPEKLVFTVQPPDSIITTQNFSLAVESRTNADIPVPFNGTVTLSIGDNPGGAVLSGTTSIQAVNGVAVFNNISLNAGATFSGYDLIVSATGLTPDTTDPFTLIKLIPDILVYEPQVNDVEADFPFTVQVQVLSSDSQLVIDATNPVTIALASNPTSSVLGGTLTVNAVNGIATFTDLVVPDVGAGYTLQASSGALNSATSDPFDTYQIFFGGDGRGEVMTFIPLGYLGDNVWNGLVNTNWNIIGNWRNNVVPDTIDNVVIPAGAPNYPFIQSPVSITEVRIDSGGAIQVANGGSFRVRENLIHDGSLTVDSGGLLTLAGTVDILSDHVDFGQGKVILGGTDPKTLGGDTVMFGSLDLSSIGGLSQSAGIISIRTLLELSEGNWNTNGNALILASSAAHEAAQIHPAGNGSITGDVTQQRYIPGTYNGGLTFGGGYESAYHYAGGPFVNSDVNEFADFAPFNPVGSACLPNCTYQNIGTFFSFDETEGNTTGPQHYEKWKDVTAISRGTGYAAHIRDAVSAATTLDFEGPYDHSVKGYSVSLSHTPGVAFEGWNLLSNPHPTNADWTQVAKNNVYDALYFWDPVLMQYTAYINAGGSPSGGNISTGANPVILPMQGFFAVANGPGASLDFTEQSRDVSASGEFYKQGENAELVRLGMTRTDNGFTDQMVVYFDDRATESFDGSFDAFKNKSTSPWVPTLYAIASDNTDLTIDARGEFNRDYIIPLGVDVEENASIDIHLMELLNTAQGVEVILEDRNRNLFHDLTSGPFTVNLNKSANAEGRFYLHVNQSKTSTVAEIADFPARVYQQGNALIVDFASLNDELVGGSIQVLDMMGRSIIQVPPTNQELIRIDLGNVAAGIYVLHLDGKHRSYSRKVLIN